MVRQIISYLLVTLICLGSCKTASTTTPPPPQIDTAPSWFPVETLPRYFKNLNKTDYDPYPFVGSVNHAEGQILIGSGVIIEPSVVLTAAHVSDGKKAEDLIFITQDGDEHCIKEVLYYPVPKPHFFFNSVSWSEHYDISILMLEDECDEIPINLFNDRVDSIYKGEDLTMIGYSGGIKRYSTEGVFWYYGRFIKKPQFLITLPIKETVWFGDSGGALITDDGKLIGIVSYMARREGILYENGFSSIEYYYDWIDNEVGN